MNFLEENDLTMTYDFHASKKKVFTAFSEIDALNEWWGPVECKNTALKLEFKTGGIFLYKMEKEGTVNYGRFTFITIKPYELLEFTNSFSDAEGNVIRAPFDIQLPMKIFYRLEFAEHGDQTRLTLIARAIEATAAEKNGLRLIHQSMKEGFSATFDNLKSFLKKIQKPQI